MTQTSHLSSGPITNLDGTSGVITANTEGEGAPARLKEAFGYVTVVAADVALSTYRLVRVPSAAIIKSIVFESEAQGAGKVQLGLYYSDSTYDGTLVAKQGLVVTSQASVSQVNLFSGDIDCASAVTKSERLGVTATNIWTMDMQNKPLWKAANLAADPGGFFDVVATVHTTDMTTGTGKLGASVRFA